MTGQREQVRNAIEKRGGDALSIINSLSMAGFAVVPRIPTPEMLKEAWAYIHDEDGFHTWTEMVGAYEGGLGAESIGNSTSPKG